MSVNRKQVETLLQTWIARRVDPEAQLWLDEKRAKVQEGGPGWVLFTSFSAVPRYTGKEDLALTDADLEAAEAACPGWRPASWSIDQVGRTLLLLALPTDDADAYLRTLDKLFETADVGESVVLYQALPLLAHPVRLVARATDGLRTNMTSVFNAIALQNPYPKTYFEEPAWNQMVLKAVFVGSPLHRIDGLDERANADLAGMLVDYAHERWAADRTVTPELWRPVGPFAKGTMVDDLEKVLASSDPAEPEAAALALAASPDPRAAEVLAARPQLRQAIEQGELTWDSLAHERLAA